jgi:hypothetical protein
VKRLYKNRSLAFKNEVITLDAPYSRHAATPQDMIRGRLPYDIGKIPETAEEIQQCEELVENFYMKFMHMDKASALREADKLAATLTGNQAILSQAGIRVHVGVGDMPKGASTNCDLVRSEGVEHSEQCVRRRVERYKWRRHCLAPVHAVGVFAIAGAAA